VSISLSHYKKYITVALLGKTTSSRGLHGLFKLEAVPSGEQTTMQWDDKSIEPSHQKLLKWKIRHHE
jgi:hypothetical protein